jgi:hypothetical protein
VQGAENKCRKGRGLRGREYIEGEGCNEMKIHKNEDIEEDNKDGKKTKRKREIAVSPRSPEDTKKHELLVDRICHESTMLKEMEKEEVLITRRLNKKKENGEDCNIEFEELNKIQQTCHSAKALLDQLILRSESIARAVLNDLKQFSTDVYMKLVECGYWSLLENRLIAALGGRTQYLPYKDLMSTEDYANINEVSAMRFLSLLGAIYSMMKKIEVMCDNNDCAKVPLRHIADRCACGHQYFWNGKFLLQRFWEFLLLNNDGKFTNIN